MNSTKIAERIYDTLNRQKFADWYSDSGTFGKHITGEFTLTDAQILSSIKEMFNLVDEPEPAPLARGRLTTPVGVFDLTIRFKGISLFGHKTFELVIVTSSVPEKIKVGHKVSYSENDLEDLREKGMLNIFED
jgi:hypothetical protein